MYRALIVEDDAGIAEAIRRAAGSWDLEVTQAEDLHDVMASFAAVQPHIVLLDISLPFFNGYHWCSEIRRVSNVPILFLSSAADNLNIVMAMNMGADDFAASAPVLEHRGALLHTGEQTLAYNGKTVPLTKNEYRILLCLLRGKGTVVSREKLMEQLWQTDAFVDENTLNVNIGRLRKKLDAAGLHDFITTRIGAGYLIG